jgi:hypothetical protein
MARDVALVQACLRVADMEGFSGEDKYTLIAYHAVNAVRELHQRLIDAESARSRTYVLSGQRIDVSPKK